MKIKRIDAYQCGTCNTAYFDKEGAERCQSIHSLEENLEITEIREWDPEEEYPYRILVIDKKNSGHAAEYKKVKTGSIEDFYE